MAFKIKTILTITLWGCMMNSCPHGKSPDVDKNDRIPSKFIKYSQYIINPQNGECYSYADSILYWKKYKTDILLVYISELTGENIYSPHNIIIIKEDGIIHIPCLTIYDIRELKGNVLSIEDSGSLEGSTMWGTHIFHFDKEIVHDYLYIVDSLKDGASVKKQTLIEDNT